MSTMKGSSPISDLSADLPRHVSRDLYMKQRNKGFTVLDESAAVSFKMLPKAEDDEEFKLRKATSPTFKRELSVTPNKYDEAVSVSADEIREGMVSPASPPSKKKKAYLLPPMEDPEAERKRRNAITAWQNRVRRKKETEALGSELEKLKENNKRLEGVVLCKEEELRQCREELRRLRAQAGELREEKRVLEEQNRTQQEKFGVIREHIILIGESLEEDNLARRFLVALLDRLDTTFPPSIPHSSASSLSSAYPRSSLDSSAGPLSLAYPRSSVVTITPLHGSTTSPPLAVSPSHIISPPRSTISPSHITSSPRSTISPPHNTSSPPLSTATTAPSPRRVMPLLIPVLPSSREMYPSAKASQK